MGPCRTGCVSCNHCLRACGDTTNCGAANGCRATTAAAQPTAAPAEPTAAAQRTAAGAADAANTLVWVRDLTDIVSFDPAQAYEFSGILGVHSIYDTLVKFEGSDLTELKPGLAEKWDIKDAGDHWEVTFNLKDGIKFASGNPFTADDVVFSLQHVR